MAPVLNRYMIEHPRRLLLLLLAALVMIIGTRLLPYAVERQAPTPAQAAHDQATLDELRSRFAQSAWEPSLVSVHWRSSDDLRVVLDSDDRQRAMAACSDLIDGVRVQTSVSPDGVTYTFNYSDASLFIFDRSDNILVTNFSDLNTGCRWRLN